MRIVQLRHEGKSRIAIVENKNQLRLVEGEGGTYALAKKAVQANSTLLEYCQTHASGKLVDYTQALDQNRIEVPCMHPDPAHCLVSGTGLTHLGSAKTRSQMHAELQKADSLTDSMKMFQMGLNGGRPTDGSPSSEPEWFYKGDGSIVVPPNAPFLVPSFVEDAGEEPELAGIYIISDDGKPVCIGYCLGNEFSDHIKERRNYLLLAHSKLRPCSIGPELYLGELPKTITGTSRIIRDGNIIWEKDFVTGEDTMTHSLEGLAYHHFKYAQFRRAGDLHIHFFGTATLSFADGIKTKSGDVFEIQSEVFGQTLKNTLTYIEQ